MTLMFASALMPSLAALIVAVPGAIAEIIPEASTLATAIAELCQVTGLS